MRDTQQKILSHALALFNEYGVANVSLRQIAQAVKISQGNLNYHFKLKEDIIEALYFQLVEEMNKKMEEMDQAQANLKQLYSSSLASMQKMYDYRFILIDNIHIMSTHQVIKVHYGQLMRFRSNQFQQLFHELITKGVCRKPTVKNEYERLYERMNIVGDSWINVYINFAMGKSITYYCDLLFEMIFPYLTEQGRAEYHQILQDNN